MERSPRRPRNCRSRTPCRSRSRSTSSSSTTRSASNGDRPVSDSPTSRLNPSRKGTVPFCVDVVIPALDEEGALPRVLGEIPRGWVRRVVVADNGSTDRTAEVARAGGAEVVTELERGYGAACLAALTHLADDPPDVVVFVDGDYSDHPAELPSLVQPIIDGDADMVIGSRVTGEREAGALSVQQQVGNAIACHALRILYDVQYTDLGPFRAIRWEILRSLDMRDRDFGWTVEMQIKAAKRGIRHREVPVSYRPRIGVSKISGTIRGSVRAGAKILWLLGRSTWR
ncbi:MAG: glycosyltransferase family 2 protein [Polyangiales bacterium]